MKVLEYIGDDPACQDRRLPVDPTREAESALELIAAQFDTNPANWRVANGSRKELFVPETFANMIEGTARHLIDVNKLGLKDKIKLPPHLNELFDMNLVVGESLLGFIERSRAQGKIIPD